MTTENEKLLTAFESVDLGEAEEILKEAWAAANAAGQELAKDFREARDAWAQAIFAATQDKSKMHCRITLRYRVKDDAPSLEWGFTDRLVVDGEKLSNRKHIKKARGSYAYALPALHQYTPRGLVDEVTRLELQARRVREALDLTRYLLRRLKALTLAVRTSAISDAPEQGAG